MTTLMNPKDAIGHKIRWNTWEDGSYFILDNINGRNLYGSLYTKYDGLTHKDKFVIGKGIKLMTSGHKETSYWYLLEELKIFKLSKLEDSLFEI
jgi:hypothetical protein